MPLGWTIPRMNGIDCLRAIRAGSGIGPQAILCTTKNDSDRIIAAIDAGAGEFIMRPFNAGILVGRMNDAAMPTGGGT